MSPGRAKLHIQDALVRAILIINILIMIIIRRGTRDSLIWSQSKCSKQGILIFPMLIL